MNNLTIAVYSYNRHQDLLPYVLKSIKKHGPVCKEILVVWDDFFREWDVDFEDIKTQSGCNFRVIKHSEIYAWPEVIGRWGWIKQQLVKLFCYTYTTTKYTWIVDSDVLLTGDPELFSNQGEPYLRYDKKPTGSGYIKFIEKYLDIHNFYEHDFVGSTCLFDNYQCQQIFEHVQKKTSITLVDCVAQCITESNRDDCPFSEFETYGTWLYNKDSYNHILKERNWNYCHLEKNWHKPIQVMWQHIPHLQQHDLIDKIRWLNDQRSTC
jgi:hypothetical protein